MLSLSNTCRDGSGKEGCPASPSPRAGSETGHHGVATSQNIYRARPTMSGPTGGSRTGQMYGELVQLAVRQLAGRQILPDVRSIRHARASYRERVGDNPPRGSEVAAVLESFRHHKRL